MDWCSIQGESATLIRLRPRKPGISSGLMRLRGSEKDLTIYLSELKSQCKIFSCYKKYPSPDFSVFWRTVDDGCTHLLPFQVINIYINVQHCPKLFLYHLLKTWIYRKCVGELSGPVYPPSGAMGAIVTWPPICGRLEYKVTFSASGPEL